MMLVAVRERNIGGIVLKNNALSSRIVALSIKLHGEVFKWACHVAPEAGAARRGCVLGVGPRTACLGASSLTDEMGLQQSLKSLLGGL